MKKRFLGTLFLSVATLCMVVTGIASPLAATEAYADTDGSKTVSIAFLHDLHSYLDSYDITTEDGSLTSVGGVARIKTMLDEIRAEDPEALFIDGGDFSMGTLYQTIFSTDAVELRTLGALGMDVTTMGNHEFDYRAEGFYGMFEAALDSGDTLPEFLLCNVDWESMEEKGLTEEQQLYKDCFEDYGVKDYTVLEKNGVKIALFGLFGKDALECAPTCVLEFEDPIEAATETVAEIKENEDVDMIIAVSHSGTSEVAESEDEELAKAVPDIDLIISGHSHTLLEEPIVHGNTSIVSCECYGKYLGTLTMSETDQGRWEVSEYETKLVDDNTASDEEMLQSLADYMTAVDEKYLSTYGYTANQVIAYNPESFDDIESLRTEHTEHDLGSLMADAYKYAVEKAEGGQGDPVDIAVLPAGTIRGTFLEGDVTVKEVFESFSLGTGADGKPGYPLISVYMSGADIKNMCEVDASISDSMQSARLYLSGISITYNPNRMILNRLEEVNIMNDDGTLTPIEDDKMYRLVADLYTGQMLASVSAKSYGLLGVSPKMADGSDVVDFEDCIIYDGDEELKAWIGIAQFMESFDKDEDGMPVVSTAYHTDQGRKILDDDDSLWAIIKNPNRIAMMLYLLVLTVIFVVALVVVIVVHNVKKRKNKPL